MMVLRIKKPFKQTRVPAEVEEQAFKEYTDWCLKEVTKPITIKSYKAILESPDEWAFYIDI